MKKTKIEEKVKQLEKCIKNKDKRITKMENRWNNIKRLVGTITLIGFFAFLIINIIYLSLSNCEIFMSILLGIGIIIMIFVISASMIYTIGGINLGFDDDDLCFITLFFGSMITFAICFVILLHTINSIL